MKRGRAGRDYLGVSVRPGESDPEWPQYLLVFTSITSSAPCSIIKHTWVEGTGEGVVA